MFIDEINSLSEQQQQTEKKVDYLLKRVNNKKRSKERKQLLRWGGERCPIQKDYWELKANTDESIFYAHPCENLVLFNENGTTVIDLAPSLRWIHSVNVMSLMIGLVLL